MRNSFGLPSNGYESKAADQPYHTERVGHPLTTAGQLDVAFYHYLFKVLTVGGLSLCQGHYPLG